MNTNRERSTTTRRTEVIYIFLEKCRMYEFRKRVSEYFRRGYSYLLTFLTFQPLPKKKKNYFYVNTKLGQGLNPIGF